MPTILVIDDDVYLRMALQVSLEKEDFEVLTAIGGREGLDVAARENPDLIVLDLAMPDLDGTDVLGQLRDDIVTWDIPVVVFTARGDSESRAQSQRLGAMRFMQKPFSLNRLVSEIKRILGGRDSQPNTVG